MTSCLFVNVNIQIIIMTVCIMKIQKTVVEIAFIYSYLFMLHQLQTLAHVANVSNITCSTDIIPTLH